MTVAAFDLTVRQTTAVFLFLRSQDRQLFLTELGRRGTEPILLVRARTHDQVEERQERYARDKRQQNKKRRCAPAEVYVMRTAYRKRYLIRKCQRTEYGHERIDVRSRQNVDEREYRTREVEPRTRDDERRSVDTTAVEIIDDRLDDRTVAPHIEHEPEEHQQKDRYTDELRMRFGQSDRFRCPYLTVKIEPAERIGRCHTSVKHSYRKPATYHAEYHKRREELGR